MSILDNLAARIFVLVIRYWRWRTRRNPQFEAPFTSKPQAVQFVAMPPLPLHTTN